MWVATLNVNHTKSVFRVAFRSVSHLQPRRKVVFPETEPNRAGVVVRHLPDNLRFVDYTHRDGAAEDVVTGKIHLCSLNRLHDNVREVHMFFHISG